MNYDKTMLSEMQDRLQDYVEMITQRKGKQFYICPICGSGTKDNGTPAFKITPDSHGRGWKCHSCGAKGDIFKLIGEVEHIDGFGDQVKRAAELFNISLRYEPNDNSKAQPTEGKRYGDAPMNDTMTAPKAEPPKDATPQKDYTNYFNFCNGNLYKTDYHRGISTETLNRFKVGFTDDCKLFGGGVSALIIPTSKHTYVARNTDSKSGDRYRKKGNTQLYNVAALEKTDKPIIFVTEGELDALSIIDAGGEAVAIGSTSMITEFAEYVKTHRPKRPLFLKFDPDEAGMKATIELGEMLRKLNISFWCMDAAHHTFCGWNVKHKDPNAFWQGDPAGLQRYIDNVTEVTLANAENIHAARNALNEVQQELKRTLYAKKTIASHIQGFVDDLTNAAGTPAISTGFKNLNKVLGGGLYEGLYSIGAISSLGKTTFTLQIADQIAAAGHDVIIFALEMSEKELIAKSVSRLMAQTAVENGGNVTNAKQVREITDPERRKEYTEADWNLLYSALNRYESMTAKAVIIEGIGNVTVDDVRQAVATHADCMGAAPVVIIDYLQMLAPQSDRMNEKQTIDKNVLELKRLSRDFKIPVIAISSLNRNSYKGEMTVAAFKESGAIEYGSDVLIGMQLQGAADAGFNEDEALKANPRKVQAKILKNRNGETRQIARFDFYKNYSLFYEDGIEG